MCCSHRGVVHIRALSAVWIWICASVLQSSQCCLNAMYVSELIKAPFISIRIVDFVIELHWVITRLDRIYHLGLYGNMSVVSIDMLIFYLFSTRMRSLRGQFLLRSLVENCLISHTVNSVRRQKAVTYVSHTPIRIIACRCDIFFYAVHMGTTP